MTLFLCPIFGAPRLQQLGQRHGSRGEEVGRPSKCLDFSFRCVWSWWIYTEFAMFIGDDDNSNWGRSIFRQSYWFLHLDVAVWGAPRKTLWFHPIFGSKLVPPMTSQCHIRHIHHLNSMNCKIKLINFHRIPRVSGERNVGFLGPNAISGVQARRASFSDCCASESAEWQRMRIKEERVSSAIGKCGFWSPKNDQNQWFLNLA